MSLAEAVWLQFGCNASIWRCSQYPHLGEWGII